MSASAASGSSSWWSANHTSDLSWWLGDEAGEEKSDEASAFGKSEENEKDCVVFVIDCMPAMFVTAVGDDGEQNSPFDRCCEAITASLKNKIIKSKDDVVSIVLFNSRESKNAMNHSNIYVFAIPDTASATLIKNIRDLPQNFDNDIGGLGKGKQCDFRDVLWTLQQIFSEVDVQGTKFGTKRAFIFTTNDAPKCGDPNATRSKANDMSDAGISIDLFPLCADVKQFSVSTFYGDLITIDADEFRDENDLQKKCRTTTELVDNLRVKEVKKRSYLSLPLSIGADFNVAVKLYCSNRRATKDTPTWLDARTDQPLTTETRWICADTGAVLDDTTIKTYHEYGPEKTKVYFTKEEMKDMKTFGNPSMVLMGFKPLDRLKSYYNTKPAYFMYPDESRIIGSTVAFASLLKAMVQLKRFAVARFIARKVGGPRFVALVAQEEKSDSDGAQIQPPGMHLIFLPYADDIRKITAGSGAARVSNDDPSLIVKAKTIIDVLEVKDIPHACNPTLQRHYDGLESMALGEPLEEGVDEIEPDDAGMIQLAGDLITDFKNALPSVYSAPSAAASRKRANDAGGASGKRAKVARKNNDTDASSAAVYNWKQLAENDELKSLKVADLKIYLGAHSLPKSGRKAELIARIMNDLGL